MAETVPPALPVQLDLVVKHMAEAVFTQLKALARSSKIQDSGTRRRDLSDWSRLTMNSLLRLLALPGLIQFVAHQKRHQTRPVRCHSQLFLRPVSSKTRLHYQRQQLQSLLGVAVVQTGQPSPL